MFSAGADGLQDLVLLTFDARRGLPHNIWDAKLPEGRKIGKANMDDWLNAGHISSEHPTQKFPNLFVGDNDLLRKHANQGSAYMRTMII